MQTSDSKKVKRAGLLKRFLNVFGCLVPDAKHDPADKTLHLARALQSPAKRVLHPCPRFLSRMQNRVSTAVSNERAILRIANEQNAANVAAREIRAHIEFAGISRRRDYFRISEKPQFIAKFRRAFPAHLPDRARGLFPAFEFN